MVFISFLAFILALLLFFGALSNIAHVGKPREPLTKEEVATATAFSALLIVSLVLLGIYALIS